MTSEETHELMIRFQKAAAAAVNAEQKLQLEAIEYYLFHPVARDVVKAAEMLSEIGF